MTFLSRPSDAKKLNLPGRCSSELIGGNKQAKNVSLRYVTINPKRKNDQKRKAHYHPNTEECIYVLSGHGLTWSGGKKYEIQSGDSIFISKGEHHFTENIGSKDLKLLCFFPNSTVELIEIDE